MKNNGKKHMFLVILEALPVLLFSYTAQVLFKQGMTQIGKVDPAVILSDPLSLIVKLITTWQIVVGFVLAGAGAMFYLYALSKNDFSIVFPVLGAMGFIILPLVGRFILHEPVSLVRVIGTVVIAIGMLIVTRG